MDKLLEVRGTVTVTDRWYRDIGLEEKEQKEKKKKVDLLVLAGSQREKKATT